MADYRLDFIGWSNLRIRASATIIETPGFHVWEVIWELDKSDIDHLDHQEAGDNAFKVDVVTHSGAKYNCRVYQQIKVPNAYAKLRELRNPMIPSQTYLKIIIKEALDRVLPIEYIYMPRKIRYSGFMDSYRDIGYICL
ncbi:gamma-glutamylcyclotransferase-like [Cotesia glomerata]|uniref:gamma-glutamylcyclotransferase-like n=1 Tax=Cotesia glomerata TaxID=32391 RepID=UPI001D00BEEA|nr:gamma-glutamylcyclotransferase-like [Cotesia glomerata]